MEKSNGDDDADATLESALSLASYIATATNRLATVLDRTQSFCERFPFAKALELLLQGSIRCAAVLSVLTGWVNRCESLCCGLS